MAGPAEPLEKRLRAIYSDTTVDHILHPRNSDSFPNPDGIAERGSGAGESIKTWVGVRNDVVERSGFWTNGCAATIACASMGTELIKGKPVREALLITARDIAGALVDLPQGNFHCAELAAGVLRDALMDCLAVRRQPWKRFYR